MGTLSTLGEAMVTFSTPRIGPLRYAQTADLSMCGSESTVAIGARRLGHDVSWISRLGDDEPGELIRTRLLGERVRVFANTAEEPTGIMIKEHPSAGVRRVHYYRADSAASRLSPDDVPAGVIEASDILHTSGITSALSPSCASAVQAAIARAKNADTLVSFDVNYRSRLWAPGTARIEILPLLGDVDILFSSVEEAQLLLDTERRDQDWLANKLQQLNLSQVVVTDGAHGAWWDDGRERGFEPAIPTVEVDPFGAGDAFVAGYLASLLNGLTAGDCAHHAAQVAAVAVGTEGDWEGLPHSHNLSPAGSHFDISISR